MGVTRVWVWGRWRDVGQREQTFSYKVNNFWGSNIHDGDYI